jgi:heterodisulfide reductase subunit A-like polyferredoxin
MASVLVVGGGVIGLTAAIRQREAGIAADVVAREPPHAWGCADEVLALVREAVGR